MEIAAPSENEASLARQKYFHRFIDHQPNSKMTVAGYAKASGTAKLSLDLELWPDNWGRIVHCSNTNQ